LHSRDTVPCSVSRACSSSTNSGALYAFGTVRVRCIYVTWGTRYQILHIETAQYVHKSVSVITCRHRGRRFRTLFYALFDVFAFPQLRLQRNWRRSFRWENETQLNERIRQPLQLEAEGSSCSILLTWW
jgi:hypothetical protein